jgi:tetratricopeptide (TPR) repeat protein
MKRFIARAGLLASLAVLLVVAGQARLGAQKKNDKNAPPPGALGGAAPPPAKGAPGLTKDQQAEVAAYKEVFDSKDDAHTIQAGEAFVAKYPMSMYLFGVYSQLTTAYLHTNQTDKMFDVGNKALAINPDSIDVLPVLAWAIPRQVNSKTADGPQQLQKAENYAKHGIELLNALPKPATLDDATFAKAKNENLSMCYSGLGTADIKRGKYQEAATELDQAVALTASPDPVDLYLLGLADEQTNHFTKGIAAFTKCAADPGQMQPACKSGIDDTKKKAATSIEAP